MISIIIPSLGRAEQLCNCLRELEQSVRDSEANYEVIIILDEVDPESQDKAKNYIINISKRPDTYTISTLKGSPTAIEKWNHGARKSIGEWLVLAADDLHWTYDWMKASLATDNKGFLALRDTYNSAKAFEPHYMSTREWLKKNQGGVLAVPHYTHWGPDLEIAMRARNLGHYQVSNAILPHTHWIWGTAIKDNTYKRAEETHKKDLLLFEERMKKNFPDDFENVL